MLHDPDDAVPRRPDRDQAGHHQAGPGLPRAEGPWAPDAAVPHRSALRPPTSPAPISPPSTSSRTPTSRSRGNMSESGLRHHRAGSAPTSTMLASRTALAPILYVHGDTTTAMAGAVARVQRRARAGARRGRAADALAASRRSSSEWIEALRIRHARLGRPTPPRPPPRATYEPRQPGTLAGAVQHPGRRRRLPPARRPGRAQPRVPHRRGLRPAVHRRGQQLGRRRRRAVTSSHADAHELFDDLPAAERRRASSASACTGARTPWTRPGSGR